MKILPVIDLQAGQVVRGVAGRRNEYRPVVSTLCSEPTPEAVSVAFVEKLGASEVYVADLDAIAGAEPDWTSLAQIATADLKLWLDCGISDVRRAEMLAAHARRSGSLEGVVVALESVADPQMLKRLFAALGSQFAVFSLDLKAGLPHTVRPAWQGKAPLEIARIAVEIGFERLIALDLAQVGVGQGPSLAPLCQALRTAHPKIQLAAGGGVRGPLDLALLASAGCNYALVASALHDGRLTAEHLVIEP